jgi:hypothetical protein
MAKRSSKTFVVKTPETQEAPHIAEAVFEVVVAQVEAQAEAAPQPEPEILAVPTSLDVLNAPVRGQGIGKLVKELIVQGLDNNTILAQVKEQIPGANTNKACISWYRADLKKKAAKPVTQE